MNSIFHRTSVRTFQKKDIEKDKIELMLRAAMAAPSAGNQQPWEFYVVKDKTVLEELSMCSPYAEAAKEAPVAIVACYRTDVRFPENVHMDMSASVENILLQADSLGLGAVWLGVAPLEERMKKVKESLKLKDGVEVFAILPCGYPESEQTQKDRYDKSRVYYIP